MMRGFTIMKCTECGNRFQAPDIEFCATVYSLPCHCPKCGSIRTKPSHLFDSASDTKFYEKVWEQMEANNKNMLHR